MIHPDRIANLNDMPIRRRRYVLYWMQAAQRGEGNPALEYAIRRANELELPVAVCFGLTDDYPDANARHYLFMLQGLAETEATLRERGIPLVVRRANPAEAALELAADAAMVVTDRGYLNHQRRRRDRLADGADCAVVRVEGEVVVPAEAASDKQEYAARTLRPKIHRRLGEFLKPVRRHSPRKNLSGLRLRDFDVSDPETALARLNVDRSVTPVDTCRGGTGEARRRLRAFIKDKLDDYDSAANDPTVEGTSGLSPYLHFGQISPLEVALAAARNGGDGCDAFLEELIVRRELAVNFVLNNPRYDTIDALPDWASLTLKKHAGDKREHTYSLDELASGDTHDVYWNAAQREMLLTGRMHGYMRMYWGKKILEWSSSPQDAHAAMLTLNDRYELDGRDPNGFTNVLWCLGLHDRPWSEREIFGKVRYMNAAGLKRKFDADAYVAKVARLEAD
ncbi:MAG: deoxyribodipyrimidine photo-lyase [Planctomycetota bacterium]